MPKYSLILLIGALLLSASVFASTPNTVTLDVKNMTCATCPITVKMALEKTPGVTKAQVDFAKKTAVVSFDADVASVGKLVDATTNAGFPSTPRNTK